MSPMVDQSLDPEIAPLVEALRTDKSVETTGSCSGHGSEPAYVSLAVRGMDGLARFVGNMNRVDREFRDEALLDLSLDWSEEVATSCDFEHFPDWIMLDFKIEGIDGPPTADLLRRIADRWTAELTQ